MAEEYLPTIPSTLIKAELEGLYSSQVLQDMQEAIKLYDVYEHGAPYTSNNNGDSIPADLKYKTIKSIIDKEARFLFSKSPDFWVDVDFGGTKESQQHAKDAASVYQKLVDAVLKKNNIKATLVKAAKDCFISKRVALIYNVDVETGMQISFLPSLEFIYDVDPNDVNILTKIVVFYGLNDEKDKKNQRIYKKKYWMEKGACHYLEEVYDGRGELVETIHPDTTTLFDFIPAIVIVNDGLTGDLMGSSEVKDLQEYESWYSRMAAADLDAERKGMNPIRYGMDLSANSTKNLSLSAGAFWDLQSDQNAAEGRVGQVGVLDTPMTYSTPLGITLDRLKNTMFEQTAVPNVSPEALRGVVSSGKTLKAIYWDLIVRCDEKMLAWRPALEFMCKCIIEGARLYPEAAKHYMEEPLPEDEYTIRVDNQYPLPEDEQEEKTIDLAEVNAQTMSKKAYMKKWRELTDEEADEELHQIALERELLEDSYSNPMAEENPEENPEEESEEGEENES